MLVHVLCVHTACVCVGFPSLLWRWHSQRGHNLHSETSFLSTCTSVYTMCWCSFLFCSFGLDHDFTAPPGCLAKRPILSTCTCHDMSISLVRVCVFLFLFCFYQATLERDGALAGQEVQTDVLRMEVGALEGELRRARQELGACKAGRREVTNPNPLHLGRRRRPPLQRTPQKRPIQITKM